MFVTFEGCEGVGKSTQLKFVEEYMNKTGQDAIFIREPGSTEISEQIRSVILDPTNTEMHDYTEALLYAASRAQLVQQVIKPALKEGKTVICDRFIDSSVAYQGYARHLGAQVIKDINKYALDGLMPDLTIFIDLAPDKCFRAVKNNDRIEQEKLSFHQDVYKGYVAEMNSSNGRIVSVKPDLNRFVTRDRILNVLRERGVIK